MDQMKKQLIILNLSGELAPELSDYFLSRNVNVINPLEDESKHVWTHIITKDLHNFDLINKTYQVSERKINLISLSKVDDLQNFTLNNGNIILDDVWFKGSMGPFILDKYFQGYGGIQLSDNYPAFKEEGSFNIANPFSTGEYLDRLVQKAFESNVEALTVKSFFDHLIMYLAGLKSSGKAGLPFEVTYGSYEEVFAVQIHFFSQGLSLDDISGSLSSRITKKTEQYLLNVAVQSSDFFDFSFMPELNKVMVTALWTTDKRIKFENRGLMFSSIQGGTPLTQYSQSEIVPSLISTQEPTDFSDKVELMAIPGRDINEREVSQTISGSDSEGESSQTIAGETSEESSTLVKGSKDLTPDEVSLIKGESALEELVQTVRGKFEKEDKSVIKIGGTKLDVEKFAYKIASSIDETTKEKNLKVRSLGNKLPESIKTGLFDFAKGLGKDVEDLDDSELDVFQLKKIPEILSSELETQVKISALASEKAKTQEMKVKSLAQQAFSSQGISPEIVKQLEARLATANSENEKLKSQMKTLGSEVRILKESRNKLAEIQMKASQAASEINVKTNEEDDKLRMHFQQKLHDQKSLNEQDLKKLSVMLEKQSNLISDFRQVETKARKLELEALQKETFFAGEIEKSERQIKAKDLILIKTKETFTKLIEKKDREIADLNSKADQLLKSINSPQNTSQAQTIKDLEKQNLNLNKQIEQYKSKITSLATNLQPSKTDEALKDETRKLQMLNQQMKNQLDVSKKEVEKLQAKASIDNSQLLNLKQEKAKLEAELKKLAFEAKNQAPQTVNNDQEMKRLQAQNQILETQVKDSAQKIMNLETKLIEAAKPQKASASVDDNSKVKLAQLENSVKKLTQDLVQARNQLGEEKKETNKLRQDKTALQNQLDKLKKEADKAKPATPKKPGGKAA